MNPNRDHLERSSGQPGAQNTTIKYNLIVFFHFLNFVDTVVKFYMKIFDFSS